MLVRGDQCRQRGKTILDKTKYLTTVVNFARMICILFEGEWRKYLEIGWWGCTLEVLTTIYQENYVNINSHVTKCNRDDYAISFQSKLVIEIPSSWQWLVDGIIWRDKVGSTLRWIVLNCHLKVLVLIFVAQACTSAQALCPCVQKLPTFSLEHLLQCEQVAYVAQPKFNLEKNTINMLAY